MSAARHQPSLGSDRDAERYLAKAIPLARELDDPRMWIVISGNFALAALFTGDTGAAAAAFREELVRCRSLVVYPFAPEGLRGLAAVAAVKRDGKRAARLVGTAQ